MEREGNPSIEKPQGSFHTFLAVMFLEIDVRQGCHFPDACRLKSHCKGVPV